MQDSYSWKDVSPEKLQTLSVLGRVEKERAKQRDKWGNDHDDSHEVAGWVQFIHDYSAAARLHASKGDIGMAIEYLVKTAALAVAAIEREERKLDEGKL